MPSYFQPLPLGKFPTGCRPTGQWITFSSVHYCAEVFYPLPYTLLFWPFSSCRGRVPFSFVLLSLVLEVSIRWDFRTLVQETNLNNLSCASKLSRFAGAEFRQSQLSCRAVFLGWEGRAEQWCRAGNCQQGRADFPCLLLGLRHPQFHLSVPGHAP